MTDVYMIDPEDFVTCPTCSARVDPDNWTESGVDEDGVIYLASCKCGRDFHFQADPNDQLFLNFYECEECGYKWEDEWTCQCDDDCPNCGARHMSPYHSEDA